MPRTTGTQIQNERDSREAENTPRQEFRQGVGLCDCSFFVQAPSRGVPYAESSPVVPHQSTSPMALALAELAQDIPGYKKTGGGNRTHP